MLFADIIRPENSRFENLRRTLLAEKIALLQLGPSSQHGSPPFLEYSSHVRVPAKLVEKNSLEKLDFSNIKNLFNRVVKLGKNITL